MKIKTLLEEEIQQELKELKTCPLATEEYKNSVDGIMKLTDRLIEFEKVEVDKYDKEDSRFIEMKLKSAELEMEQKDRKTKNWLTGISIGSGIIITTVGAWATFKFEEEGTITSLIGKGFINRLLPRK